MFLPSLRAGSVASRARVPARSRRRVPGIEPLEPRLLFSGDPAGAAAAALAEAARTAAEPAADGASLVAEREARAAASAATQAAAPRELVVVDARVPDLAAVLADLDAQRAAGRDLSVLALAAGDDGLAAVGDALRDAALGGTPYDAVHLLGHGEPGAMRLGDATLDLDALRARAGELAGWSDGLSVGADLLLWGCDVAASPDGQALLGGLASLTGADVAASVDPTGGLRLGGDWTLEAHVGEVGTAAPLGAALQSAYAGLLGPDPLGDELALALSGAGSPWSSADGGFAVASGGSNVTVVVWRDGAGGAGAGLLVQRFGADGVALGAPNAVPGAADARGVAVAVDGAGGFVVAWHDATGAAVYGQRFDASGAAQGARIRVDTGTTSADEVDVAVNASGRFVVSWTERAGSDGLEVRARVFGSDGVAASGVLDVGGPLADDQHRSAVAIRDDGRFAVVFESEEPLGFGDGIYLRRYDADGTALVPFLPVPVQPATGDQKTPDIAVDAAGDFVVVWTDEDAPAVGIFGVRIGGTSGATLGGTFQVDDAPAATHRSPSVAALAGGGFVVAWQTDAGGAAGWDVVAREFTAAGTPVDGSFALAQSGAGDQRYPAVAAGAGRATFVWAGEQGAADGVVLRAFAVGGAGVTLSPVTTVVGESGAPTGALRVVLDAAPTAPVVVTLSVDDPGAATLSTTTLTFTPGDWNVQRTITVTGVDDAVDAPDRPVSVRAQATSADLAYHGMVRVLAGFTVVDDDTAGVRLTTVGPAQTSEAGATASLRVRLDSRPTSTVTVTLAASDATEATLSATTLTFSAANWNVEQVVTVVGVDDARADGTVAYTVAATATSADAAYDGRAAAPVALVNLDDDVAGVVLVADGTTTTEAGGTRTLSVRLQSEPIGRVVVELALSDPLEARLSATTLQFTAADWNVAQTVVLTGVDDTVVDGDRGVVVTALADSVADPDYRGLAAAPLALANLDDDLRNRIVVDTASDLVDGDTGSLAALWRDRGADGRVSLREALQAAAATANGPGGADAVAFDLAGAGGRTIALQAALPVIADAIEIDGTTDPAYASVPVVRIDSSIGLAAGDGLVFAPGSEGSVVRGLSITGMQGAGVRIAASAVVVESNHLGLDASGVVAVGNGREGVRIEGGSAQQVRGNAIGGNAGAGVALVGAQGVQVTDNLLGVAVDRVTARGNGGDGVSLSGAATDNRVADNVIGGNGGAGVRIAGAGTERNLVVGNAIGTDRGGTAVLGNAAGGVLVLDGAASNRIGGVVPGEGNLIVGNGPVGVRVADASGAAQGNAILSNLIDGHGLGIDLSDAPGAAPAPTPNDPGDADVGGNGLLNTPVLLRARLSADGTTVEVAGRVEGAPGERLRVEVFADATPHPSGHGEGPRLVGAFDVVADSAGVADFVRTFAAAGVLAGGHAVSATVTRSNLAGTAWTDTSEYAVAVTAGSAPAIAAPTDFVAPENAPFAVTLAALDADTPAPALAWSIVGGPDAAGFSIDAASGTLRLLATPDHERPADADADGVHEVDVRVVDPQGLDDVRRIRVTVLDAAEAPVVQGPAAVAAVEDTGRVLSADDGTAIVVTDDDAVAAPQRVALSVDRGTLSLGSLAGLSFELGDGTGDATMRFTGSAADVAAALARLGYAPPPDGSGAAELRVAVADAADASLASAIRVAIAIAPVNDAPTLVATGPLAVQAGASRVVDATGLAAADVDDAAAAIVFVIEQAPRDGVLRLDGAALGAGDRFTQADLDAGRLRYDAPAEVGTRTLVVSVQDASGAGPGGVSIAIDVGAAPPAPPPPAPPAPPPVPGPVFAAPGAVSATPAPGVETGEQVRQLPAGSVLPAAAASAAAPPPVLPGAAAASPAGGSRGGGDEERAATRTDDGRASTSRPGVDTAGPAYEPPASQVGAHDARAPAPLEAARPGAADPARAWSPIEALRQVAFREALDENRAQAREGLVLDRTLVASTAALTAGVSIGYALWLLRGGVLLASLLASMPAWRAIDPLPVLGRLDARGRDDDGEDDSLRGIIDDAARGASAEPVAAGPLAGEASQDGVRPAAESGPRPADGARS